jgi:hypothetical protein
MIKLGIRNWNYTEILACYCIFLYQVKDNFTKIKINIYVYLLNLTSFDRFWYFLRPLSNSNSCEFFKLNLRSIRSFIKDTINERIRSSYLLISLTDFDWARYVWRKERVLFILICLRPIYALLRENSQDAFSYASTLRFHPRREITRERKI